MYKLFTKAFHETLSEEYLCSLSADITTTNNASLFRPLNNLYLCDQSSVKQHLYVPLTSNFIRYIFPTKIKTPPFPIPPPPPSWHSFLPAISHIVTHVFYICGYSSISWSSVWMRKLERSRCLSPNPNIDRLIPRHVCQSLLDRTLQRLGIGGVICGTVDELFRKG